jgi:glycosyltransferase involved in cell wall biosynthesis
MHPFFSIVVPTFNSESTLRETLHSVVGQGRSDVEVLIIDGKSSDRTIEIAKSFGPLVSQIVSEKDHGIYDAINKGIGLSAGAYINVLGSDDLFCDGALDLVHHFAVERQSAIIAGAAIMTKLGKPDEVRIDEPYGIGSLVSGIPFCHNALFVKSTAYKMVGNYSLNYRICADAHWVHRAIRMGLDCTYTGQALVKFSLEGLSSTATEKLMEETYASICENFEGLKKEDAEPLFKAVRGWTPGTEVGAILTRHRNNSNLLESLCMAFLNRANYLAGLRASSNSAIDVASTSNASTSGPIYRSARKIAALIRRF